MKYSYLNLLTLGLNKDIPFVVLTGSIKLRFFSKIDCIGKLFWCRVHNIAIVKIESDIKCLVSVRHEILVAYLCFDNKISLIIINCL